MITSAYISHYKIISDATLDFHPSNLIVGSNGVGKSNIVDALYFLHDCVYEDIDTAITRRHGISSIRQWSKSKPYNITIEARFRSLEGTGAYKLVIGSTKGSYKVVEEAGEWCGRNPLEPLKPASDDDVTRKTTRFNRDEDGRISLTSDHDGISAEWLRTVHIGNGELFSTMISSPSFSVATLLLQPLAREITSFTAYSIYPNTLREPRTVSRQERLSPDGANLASVLKRINSGHPDIKEKIIDSLKLIMPELSDFQIRSAGGYYVPVVKVGTDGVDAHFFNMSQLSDGTLRVLGLLTAFYQPSAPQIIALEEPEQMIHPGLLSAIIDAANEFTEESAEEYRQVFITTHSPTLVDLVEPESIIWARSVNGATSCGPITTRQLRLIKENLFTPGEVFLSEGFIDQ